MNRIAATKADVKEVIAYTDLSENTSVFSIYKSSDRNLLRLRPDLVKKLLGQFGRPTDLRGVSIHLLFKPKTDRENEYFTLASRFYKQLFEDAGAKVDCGGSILCENN